MDASLHLVRQGTAFDDQNVSLYYSAPISGLDLGSVILHTIMHHSSTSTYLQNVIEIEETFCGRTDGRTDGHLIPTLLGRLGGVELKSVILQYNIVVVVVVICVY